MSLAPTTHTIESDGATIVYDVRAGASATAPPLLMVGSPMGAAGFATLASFFTDRTVVTYDPRGSERSEVADPTTEVTPATHAEDIHRVITAVGAPVDLLASSGGAVNALALVASYPDDVRTLVAHEPPLTSLLPDREYAEAAALAVYDTYQRSGWGAGMAHFVALVSHRGEFASEFSEQPAPPPAAFGFPEQDDGSRDDPMLGGAIVRSTAFVPDVDALTSSATRIVPAAGIESDGELANRGGHALASLLGVEIALLPSDHGGFMGGEYGQTGDPEAFAAALHSILD